jgi:POLQ-like helicase
MRPEFNSRRLFAITRSKGKMYELDLPPAAHIAVPARDKPEDLFVLALGNLGDSAADLNDAADFSAIEQALISEDLQFSASFFDAFLASRFREELSRDVTLLAAAAYHLARRPGSSYVLARRLDDAPNEQPLEQLLRWILQGRWSQPPGILHPLFGDDLQALPRLLTSHFENGSDSSELLAVLARLRKRAYEAATAPDLLFIDVISAVARTRVSGSTWATLPVFSQLPIEKWSSVIRRPGFPKELWPSQILLGRAGFFAGAGGIIQMPTSAGKTRSVEIILRSAFLSDRAKLAVVVAPFRALCAEIGSSLHNSFRHDDITVNQLTDVLQKDFMDDVSELVAPGMFQSRSILVLTPEKFLFILRQLPTIGPAIGVVVYDEGDQFDSGSRGITYELLLTEIKALLPAGAQTVLVSAVIANAEAVGEWLIGESARVVNGGGLLPTARSVAFASWIEQLGQLMFYESTKFERYDYFVPRVIERRQLKRLRKRERVKYFPEKGNTEARDVSLYLGIRLVSKGAVAVFCGRKDTASAIAGRAVEIYERAYPAAPPADCANREEVSRLKRLIDEHYGEDSVQSRTAVLGIFVHHGNTPQGLRLAIEYAMQRELINFVICTSTLAQGVNLPIRYLIVTGVYQGGQKIKVRDFQNLIGRAGRAGMHTEGLIIFADPQVYDQRKSRRESWRFKTSVELLSNTNAEATSSSLLGVLDPFHDSKNAAVLNASVDEIWSLLTAPEGVRAAWAEAVESGNPGFQFNAKSLLGELARRRRLLSSVESYLMVNRKEDSFEVFKATTERLAMGTFAYHLATDEQKTALIRLFGLVADYVESEESSQERQAVYAKTLLGVESAKYVETWVVERTAQLSVMVSNEAWLTQVWPLFVSQVDDRFFTAIRPDDLAIHLARLWLGGRSYRELFDYSRANNGTKAWGESRRKLTEDDISDFCENTLAFECSLVISAVAQFLSERAAGDSPGPATLALFQKSLSYGLPDLESVEVFEYGFADRVIAQRIRDALQDADFESIVETDPGTIRRVLSEYPKYFETVLGERG